MSDPNTASEWAFQIFVGLFSLVLLLGIASIVWAYLLVPGWRLVRGRGRVSREVGPSLPHRHTRSPDERSTVVSPAELRERLLDDLGGRERLVTELRERLAERSHEVRRRRLDYGTAASWADDFIDVLVANWQKANGRVPRALRDFPPRAWLIEETWRSADIAGNFVAEWNERTWLHHARRGTVTAETVLADGLMTPKEYLDWAVEIWVERLKQESALGCADIFFLPVFFVVCVAGVLNEGAGLDGWVAAAIAAVALVPFMFVWREVRRRGYISWED